MGERSLIHELSGTRTITHFHPGDEVKLKYGDFPVMITRTDLYRNGKHFDYAGERTDKDFNNFLLFNGTDIEKTFRVGNNSLTDTLRGSFWDTQEKLEYPALKELTRVSVEQTQLYEESFYSEGERLSSLSGFARLHVVKMTAFDAARKLRNNGKIAVLNFADALLPGGNVKTGALSREACLCRSSSLYPCLCRPDVISEFYNNNQECKDNWFTDKLIYSPNVVIFKSDDMVPRLLEWNEWIMVDVISAATPVCPSDHYVSKTVIKNVFVPKIRNMMEAAISNEATTLIAGAFGCGPGGFPAEAVASAFLYLLRDEGYISEFNEIVFAIGTPDKKNISALYVFSQTFAGDWYKSTNDILTTQTISVDNNHNQMMYMMPTGKRLVGMQLDAFIHWRNENPYFGKKISILGDGISTLTGYNPENCKVFYNQERCREAGIFSSMDTWWGMLIDYFGSELLVNNSWAGSMVSKARGQNAAFPSSHSKGRTGELHQMDIVPDVIIVLTGRKDWLNGIKPEKERKKRGLIRRLWGKPKEAEPDYSYFSDAYKKLLSRLRHNYPKAEIWCCTLTASYISLNPSFVFPVSYGGEHIEAYNQCIRRISSEYACRLIDFYRYGIPYDSIDGNHPNVYGMRALAYMGILSMADVQGKAYLR